MMAEERLEQIKSEIKAYLSRIEEGTLFADVRNKEADWTLFDTAIGWEDEKVITS